MLERRVLEEAVAENRRCSGRERRTAPRYPSGGTVIVLSWADGEDYRTLPAKLCDISLGGGSALVEKAPAPGSQVWFRLQGDDQSPWIGATVVGVSRTGLLGRGPRLLRWKFTETCPYEIFKAAIDGFSDEIADEDFTRKNARGDWR